MSEPHRIQGPGSPAEPPQRKDRTVGADDFKKYMVEEVKEIDAEAKGKKRKKREEGEEDTEAEKKAVGAGPASFPLKPMESVEEAPLQVKGAAAPTPPTTTQGAPTTTTFGFSPNEIENYAWEDEAKRTTAQYSPDQEEAYPQSQYRQPPSPSFEGFTAPSVETVSTQAVPPEKKKEKRKGKEAERPPLHKKTAPPQKQIEKAPPSKLLAKEGKRKKGGVEEFKTFMEEAKMPPKKAKAKEAGRPPKEKPIVPAPALTTMKKEPAGKIKPKAKEEKKEEEIAGQVPAGTPPIAAGISAEKQEAGKQRQPKEERTREEKEYPSPLQIAGPQLVEVTPPGATPTAAPIAAVSPYAELHPEILSLFERMIGVMTVMKTAGITETTLVLSEKTFAGTVLSGTSIKISEYRFAAGELNLEFSGTPQAVALLQQHLPSLTAALSRAGLIVKRSDFIFSRKEALGGRGEEQKEREKGQ